MAVEQRWRHYLDPRVSTIWSRADDAALQEAVKKRGERGQVRGNARGAEMRQFWDGCEGDHPGVGVVAETGESQSWESCRIEL